MKNKFLMVTFIVISIISLSYIKLYENWEYKWKDENIWHKYETPGVPLENKNKILYLRYKIPDIDFEDPAIYITGTVLFFRLYVDNYLIYDNFGESYFSAKSIFKIPTDYKNRYLTLEVKSNKRDVGFFGEVLIGNEKELLRHQIIKESDRLLLISFNLFVGILSLIFSIYILILNKNLDQSKILFYMSLFSFSLALFIMGLNQTLKYFFDNPIFWAYAMDVGKYLSPIGLMGFFYYIFDYSSKKYIKWLLTLHVLLFLTISVIQIIKGPEINFYVKFVIILYSLIYADILFMIYNLYIGIFRFKDKKAYIFSISIIIVSIFTIYEIMGDYRIINWQRPYIQWSLFILLNSMIFLTINNVKELNIELSVANKILENWKDALELEVSKRTQDIKLLLDNSEEGFLAFNKDYIISEQYSKECERIFEEDIKGKNALNLIFNSIENKEFIKRIFDDIFNEKDYLRKEVYLTFLPNELKINDKYYKVKFKYIEYADLIMVILNNITGEKNLKLKIDEERETLKKIVSVVKNYDTFVLIIKEFENFIIQNINSNFQSLLGSIHNYKGIFSQFHLNKLVNDLHNIENKIINNAINKTDLEQIYNTLKVEIEKLESELGHNLDVILKIPKIKIIELEEKVKELSGQDELLTEIKKLRYKDLKDLIIPYIDYTKDLAKKLNKLISDPVIISKDDILVDPEVFFDFTKSLINIFRNIIDHGIESPEIRIDQGKSEKGNIKIDLFKENDKINIIIEDDGQGIDINKLKEIAIINNINYTSNKDLIDIIFMESISTSNEVTQISGRGLGLNIVKKEVEKLGGSIKVESVYGKGTKFHIIIPEVI